MRILHAIHDFLPRHRAGSEIYCLELAREQSSRHHVFVVAAEYDPATAHGTLRWRLHEGLSVVELVNNYEFDRSSDTYSSPRINRQLQHVLDAVCPDILHVHNLLGLSFDLPRLARARGIGVVATLHDYTLVCASGGQRVHVAESHVCREIDVERCSRCFGESPFAAQIGAGRVLRNRGSLPARAALWLRSVAPSAARVLAAGAARTAAFTPEDMRRRLAYARHVFDTVDLFVAPSQALADEYISLGLPADRIEVSDYGFATPPVAAVCRPEGALRIGFVGTLVWHKGAHVLVDATRRLRGSFEVHLHGDTATFPAYVDSLRRAAAGLPVQFHDGFNREQLRDVFGGLDVLVVPSLWPENSPLVIHEAYLHGVPVVAARTGGIPGLVDDGVSGLLYDAQAPEALAGCLQALLDHPEQLATLSKAAPRVKTIAEDARDWDGRYARVRVSVPAHAEVGP